MAQPDFTPDDAKLVGAAEAALAEGKPDVAKEIAELLKQNRLRRMPLPDPVPLGQAGMPQAIRQVARDEFGVGGQRMAGIGSAPMVAGHAVANLAGAENDAALQNWKSVASATPNTMGGNIAGNVLMFGAAPAGAVNAGMNIAGKTLPRWAQIADVAATQGGVAAITTPGDAGERLTAGMLGVGSAGIPGAVGAVQTGRRTLTKPGKSLDIAEALRREVGVEADTLTTGLQGRYPAESYGVRPSAAMLTRNPTLEVMETGSRTRTGDQWRNFDQMNAAARWKALEDAAGTPQELERLRAARDAITGPKREQALQGTEGALKVGAGTPYQGLVDRLELFSTGANRPNKDVQTLVNYVKGELEKGVTPEQLYTIRKMLTDGVAAGPTSELSQAARAARPQRMVIISQLDEILNDISSGRWKDYLETYKISSPLISSRTALGKVRDRIEYGRPAGEVPDMLGVKAAPYTLGRLLEQHGTKTFGSKEIDQLIPQHRELANTLLSDLKAQADVMMPRSTLGSPTAPLTANAGRVSQLTNSMVDAAGNVVPVAGGALSASVKGSLARMNEEALVELLQNPKKLAAELQRAKIASELLRQSGQVGAGSGAGIRAGRE